MSRFGGLAFLANEAPGFRLHGSQVKVLKEPGEFYENLCTQAAASKKRIILASLYLGTGDLEHRLIESVAESFEKSGGKLKVKMLLDFCRGNRLVNGQNSCTMVLPLMEKCKGSFELSLYHSPMLRGFWKKLMPGRYNEIIGIQHCKAYVFDDTTIISGANLSKDYFTNRQDRYIIIENCPKLADYFEELVYEIQMFSFQAGYDSETSKFRFTQRENWKGGHPFQGKLNKYVEEGQTAIRSFLTNQKNENSLKLVGDKFVSVETKDSPVDNHFDTWIFPAIQMGVFGIKQDCELTTKFMENAAKNSKMKFGTGYFNLTQDYLNVIMYRSSANYDLLMAHPKANGFLGAKGPAGGIPAAYTLIAKMFFDLLTRNRLHDRIKMFEYQKDGWTFHAKGLWYYPPLENTPVATLIGSPNFGYRSEERDLECQLTIVTNNDKLKKELHEEQVRLFQDSTSVSTETFTLPERKVPTWVTWVVGLARNFF